MINTLRSLRPVDALIIAFLILLSGIDLFFVRTAKELPLLLTFNFVACVGIVAVARWKSSSAFTRSIHTWYPVAAIFLVFKEMYVIIQSQPRQDWDDLLIIADRWLFGTDPTVWFVTYSTPWLTELLQISYVSYYFLMLAVGIELFARKDHQNFSYVLFVIVYGFFLSYLGYLAFPAIGPRFTLHDFGALNTELPGLWLTNGLRDFVNAGESIPKGSVDAMMHAQRDAFPSGHTQMTLISMYFAHHFRLRSRFVIDIFGILLIISTVYLRYHYVVDLIGGLAFMLFTILTAPQLVAWWNALQHQRSGA